MRVIEVRSLPLLIVLVASGIASAHPVGYDDPPPPPPAPHLILAADPPVEWRHDPALVEWSTWIGFGAGVASSPPTAIARGAFETHDLHAAWIFSTGVEATLPITHAIRIGPWVGLHDLEPMAGAELAITRSPAKVDLFWYDGEGVWTLRAGAGLDHMTAALAWGYRCPWKLWGPYTRTSRYEIGVRFVMTATRAYSDPRDWTATLGLEVEPVGALRYLLGIRSWY
ncbi:MAG: hypothetical protein ABJE66_00690 [Deltaproteobacteria bacterium]